VDDVRVIDGGLATELERRGHDLTDHLWSARLLADDPEAIRRIHADYLDAGADVVISASYQASVDGFARAGIERDEAEQLLRRSVRLARAAVDEHAAGHPDRRPLVAASVGPYGATLADGSEYRGDDGLSVDELVAFHEPRIEVLLAAAPDLLAVETIPSMREVQAVIRVLDSHPDVPAWISCTGRDGARIADGTPIAEVAPVAASGRSVVAFGVNCTPPSHVPSLLREARRGAPAIRLLTYPNAGAAWDAASRAWVGTPRPVGELARAWLDAGASAVGGCCGTGPDDIAVIAAALRGT
jgi:homocysteine S-methyltransferase